MKRGWHQIRQVLDDNQVSPTRRRKVRPKRESQGQPQLLTMRPTWPLGGKLSTRIVITFEVKPQTPSICN